MSKVESISKFALVSLMTATILCLSVFTAIAGNGNKKSSKSKQLKLWEQVDKGNLSSKRSQFREIPDKVPVYSLNLTLLKNVLAQAPMEFTDAARMIQTILEIPMPDGKIARFRLEESPMLAPEVAAQFPTWKTYSGQGIDDPTAVARFDLNLNGFHGYVMGATGTFLIDPYSLTDKRNYLVYYKSDMNQDLPAFTCDARSGKDDKADLSKMTPPDAFTNGTQLRTFKIAFSATPQYTTTVGSVAAAFAGIQTTVNRLITIYRRDLATTFTLVSDQRTVYTTENTGGFLGNANNDIPRNQVVLDMVYGNANYDIGHVMSGGPGVGGAAASPSLCSPTQKAEGFTGSPTPLTDAFLVDFVAHEIGHQFGMSHTFNNDFDGTCDQREAGSAYEPASGVTIMGYAGICAPRNLSRNSIEYFGLRSFDQTLLYLQTTIPANYPTCGTLTASGNTAPTVTAPAAFTIPRLTPFTLTATGMDANMDAITYLWEEFDLGAPTRNGGAADDDATGIRPILRPYNPTPSPSRTFPALEYILNPANNDPAGSNQPSLTYTGTLPNAPTTGATIGYVCSVGETCARGERLPNIARVMNFRVTVRDNSAIAGGVADAAMASAVTVSANSGPFMVTNQNAIADLSPAVTWQAGQVQPVTWDVANTNGAPVNAANVKISLSTDGGQTFPITIAASTPNDGTEQITVPNNPTTTARIKVEAVGNIFFDINNVDFTITANPNARTAPADFDGDGKTDPSIFRPGPGEWWWLRSLNGGNGAVQFGASTDTLAPADYTGDRKADVAFFRPGTGSWFVLRSEDFSFYAFPFGGTGDTPAPADYDGDGKADPAIFRPASATWFILNSGGGTTITQFGAVGDLPVPADYDGDQKADLAIFRPSDGTWWINRSTGGVAVYSFGSATDRTVQGDYTGDGKADVAFFRPATGFWFILRSEDASFYSFPFGVAGDIAAPGDYDGDGKFDPTVFRPSNSTWFKLQSTSGFEAIGFGLTGDVPVPSAFVR